MLMLQNYYTDKDAVYDDAEFDAAANTSVDANAAIDDAVADDDAYSEAADADSDSDSDAFDYMWLILLLLMLLLLMPFLNANYKTHNLFAAFQRRY